MEIDKNFELIQTINQLDQHHSLDKDKVYLIYELSFLKIFLAWETFIEKSFIFYMLGKVTESGYKPRSYTTPVNEHHAYNIIKSGKQFPEWSNVGFIREKAELFFEKAEPFVDILNNSTINEGLIMAKKVRNRIVHVSKESIDKFKDVIRGELGYAKDITPGEFLAMFSRKRKSSYADYFKKIFLIASEKIVK